MSEAAADQVNVLGGALTVCSTEPLTGFYRDGYTTSGPDDFGSHTVCAMVTAEFLEHQRAIGNDLSTPLPQYGFPGLVPGDQWAVCAGRWLQSHQTGISAPVVLAATNALALDIVPMADLQSCAADAPDDPSALVD